MEMLLLLQLVVGIVLPSSFTGGKRYMFNNCQDAMAIYMFLIVTCNPKWVEIQRHLSKSKNFACYRPDICCRVFQVKLKEMMTDFKKGNIFGKVRAGKYYYIWYKLVY